MVSIIINYDLPLRSSSMFEYYLARIGRSGNFDRKYISFCTAEDVLILHELEAHFNTQIDELPANFGLFPRELNFN